MMNFTITKVQWSNLLPVMRENLLVLRHNSGDKYYFIGSLEKYKDAMRRCLYVDQLTLEFG